MNKKNILLALLLIIQAGIIAYVYKPVNQAKTPVVHFLSGITPDRITGLQISDETKKSITLEKGDKGWTITSDKNYPVDREKLESLLKKITSLQSTRLVTRTKASHGRLKVAKDDYNRMIEATIDNAPPQTIYLGTSPSYKTIHVRLAGKNEVYLVKGFSVWEAPVENNAWWPGLYINIPPEELVKVEINNAHGVFNLQKNDQNHWRLTVKADKDGAREQQADDSRVNDFLRRICRIPLTDYLGREDKKEYGLAAPSAMLTLTKTVKGKNAAEDTTGGHDTITLKIGKEDKESSQYTVKASNSPYYVKVASYAVKALIDQKFADLAAPDDTTP